MSQENTSPARGGLSARVLRGLKRMRLPALFGLLLIAGLRPADARPGEGVRLGHLVLSPFVDVSGTYDSNVRLTEDDTEDDIFADLLAGIAFVNATEQLRLGGRGWVQQRRYFDLTDMDHDEWGERVTLSAGSHDRLAVNLHQKYRHTEDFERSPGSVDYVSPESQGLVLSEDRTTRVPRDLNDIGVALGRRLTDKLTADAGFSFSAVDYEGRYLYDWSEDKLQGELGLKITEKSDLLGVASYGRQRSDGLSDDPDFYALRAGLQTHRTDKLTLKASAGVEGYRISGEGPLATNSDFSIFSFDGAATWRATAKLKLQVTGRNGIQPAAQYAENTVEVLLSSLSAEYQIDEKWLVSLTGSYRKDDYRNAESFEDGDRRPESRQVAGHARLNYAPPRRFYGLYAEVRYEDTDATWMEYEQLRATLGLSLRY